MTRLKKIFFFVLGFFLVPTILGSLMAFLRHQDFEFAINFFGGAYLFLYIFFNHFYNENVQKKISNKYCFYLILYIPFILLYCLF